MNETEAQHKRREWRCFHRLVRRLPIFDFDSHTESVTEYGCPTAEEQAALRYGANWRAKYRASRETERRKRWPILSVMFPTNVELTRGADQTQPKG